MLGFVVTAYIATRLGPANFGVISLAQAVLTYFLITTDLGLRTWATGELASSNGEVADLADNVFSLRLILAAMSFVVLTFFVMVLNFEAQTRTVLLMFGLCVFPAALSCEWVYVGSEKMHYIGLSWLVNRGLYALLIFVWVRIVANVLVVSISWFISAVIGTLFLQIIFRSQFRGFQFRVNLLKWRQMLKASVPMAMAYFMTQIYYNFDTIMLKFMKGDEVVGWYNAAYKLVLLLVGFGGLISTAILPTMFRLFKHSIEELVVFMNNTFRLMVVIGLPIAVSGIFFSSTIVTLIYGAKYTSSAVVLAILLWTVFTVFTNIPFATCLLASKRQTKYLLSVSIGAGVNLLLNFLLIPRFSLVGASVATIITEFTVLVLLIWQARQVATVSLSFVLLRGLFAGVVLSSIFYFLQLPVVIELPLGIGVYLGLIFMIGILRKDDLHWFVDLLPKHQESGQIN